MKIFTIWFIRQGVECMIDIEALNEDHAWGEFFDKYGSDLAPQGIAEKYES